MGLVRWTSTGLLRTDSHGDLRVYPLRAPADLLAVWFTVLTLDPTLYFGDVIRTLDGIHRAGPLEPVLHYFRALIRDAGRTDVPRTDLDYVEVYRQADAGDTINDPVHMSCSFHGIGTYGHNDGTGSGDGGPACPENCTQPHIGPWAIEFTPMAALMACPIRLNHEVRLDVKTSPWGPDIDYEGPVHSVAITVGEFVEAIFWEMSFGGPPLERDEKREELMKMVAEVFDSRSGKEAA